MLSPVWWRRWTTTGLILALLPWGRCGAVAQPHQSVDPLVSAHGFDPLQQCRAAGLTALEADAMCPVPVETAASEPTRPAGGDAVPSSASAGAAGESTAVAAGEEQAALLTDGGQTVYLRGKDAGKTCKERFSYSSFDAGATVVKTGGGAHNAKAILTEHKDAYMLLECAATDKHVVVELSDDILLDTVVLANFEFFSSMVRHFRVSVSDRYPAKPDKWRDLGTFEARNSRDIQPFLVENPQIWARYVRVDFLSHYGNEYYCPLSLLRIHGTRMIESWQDTREDDDDDDDDAPPQPSAAAAYPPVLPPSDHSAEPFQEPALAPSATNDTGSQATLSTVEILHLSTTTTTPVAGHTCWNASVVLRLEWSSCAVPSADTNKAGGQTTDLELGSGSSSSSHSVAAEPGPDSLDSSASDHSPHAAGETVASAHISGNSPASSARADDTAVSMTAANSHVPSAPSAGLPASLVAAAASAPTGSRPQNMTAPHPAVASPSPTVQESFFKTVSKRLQQLEVNITQSVRLMNEHAHHVQTALDAAERQQRAFLDAFNATVLAELRQLDRLWRATNASLHLHRDESQRDLVDLDARLTLVADWVRFQKHIAVFQSLLLVACLALVLIAKLPKPIFPFSLPSASSPTSASASAPPVRLLPDPNPSRSVPKYPTAQPAIVHPPKKEHVPGNAGAAHGM